MKSSAIKLTVLLPAKPNEVFKALTQARIIPQWNGQKGRVEAKVGGKFDMFDGWVKGKVLEFKPGKALSYTWHPADWPEGAVNSIVKYTLAPARSGTRITLSHVGFPNKTERKNHRNGWKEFVFDPLKEYLAGHHQSRSQSK